MVRSLVIALLLIGPLAGCKDQCRFEPMFCRVEVVPQPTDADPLGIDLDRSDGDWVFQSQSGAHRYYVEVEWTES